MLVFPNEESVFVFLRIYFLSSVTCSFNDTIIQAGTTYQIGLDYNSTYSLYFQKVNMTGGFTFNLYTGFEEEYYDYQIFDVDRRSYEEGLLNSWLLGAGSVAFGIFAGYQLKKWTRERDYNE